MSMELAMIGLGRMGANMAERLVGGGHRVVAFDLDPEAVAAAAEMGCDPANSLAEVAEKLSQPRVAWVMVPSGEATGKTIQAVAELFSPGDVIIDGGNSFYKDTMLRRRELAGQGISFVDVGTSGGVWGLAEGYSMMIGGQEEAVTLLEPILKTLAPGEDKGWGRVGPSGSGHFVKMVHNGIEYGMMQAYAEGFELLEAKEEFGLDLTGIAKIWQHGSVVRSWLLDLTAAAIEENPALEGVAPFVSDSGEGRWTVLEGVELGVPLPVITLALQSRFKSQDADSFAQLRRQTAGRHARPVRRAPDQEGMSRHKQSDS
jgi:6-phosphogluconate dehydrogenase